MHTLKKTLHQHCISFVNNQLQTIEMVIASHKNSLQSETKSSAGDKHETGRAMVQLEMEKAGKQLNNILQMKTTLQKIDLQNTGIKVHLGSLVITNKASYFLSVSTGKMKVNDTIYFAISTQTPIGKLLLGKQAGEIVSWNGMNIKIKEIY